MNDMQKAQAPLPLVINSFFEHYWADNKTPRLGFVLVMEGNGRQFSIGNDVTNFDWDDADKVWGMIKPAMQELFSSVYPRENDSVVFLEQELKELDIERQALIEMIESIKPAQTEDTTNGVIPASQGELSGLS